MDLYEISKDTCALLSLDENTTEVIEKTRRFIVENSTKNIMKTSCEYYGSTFAGRLEGSKKQLGMLYKLPITVEAYQELIFIPTSSPLGNECSWIALNHIKDYKSVDNCTLINFNDGQSHKFEMTKSSLENQLFRATKLLLINQKRIKYEKIGL